MLVDLVLLRYGGSVRFLLVDKALVGHLANIVTSAISL
jgi:hypothetical protein